MNLYWRLQPAVNEHPARGDLLIHKSRIKSSMKWYPMNRWGVGYWLRK
jgi:hypothetical protein